MIEVEVTVPQQTMPLHVVAEALGIATDVVVEMIAAGQLRGHRTTGGWIVERDSFVEIWRARIGAFLEIN